MLEGWHGDEYLCFFEDPRVTAQYDIARFLPGYELIGMRGWDDAIVRDLAGRTFTVPFVPLSTQGLEPYVLRTGLSLERDGRYDGKVKWYVKPVVFGGDPDATGDNVRWIDHAAHAKLVIWWNDAYLSIVRGRSRT